MTRAGTIFLVVLALMTAAFFLWIEPHMVDTRGAERERMTVLDFSPSDVESIRVRSGEDTFEITRKGSDWRIGPVLRDRAAPEVVNRLLDTARDLQVVDFLSGSEFRGNPDHSDFGLESGQNRVELKLDDRTLELWFGHEGATDGRGYVRRADSDHVYLVEDTLEELVFSSPTEFRDRRLSNLQPANIDRFVMKRPDGEIELHRTPRGWEITRPLRARADTEKVERLLSPVLGTRIFEFLADGATDLRAFGPSDPRGEWIFFPVDDSRAQALRIGEPTEFDGNAAVVAQFTPRDAVVSIPVSVWDALQVSPDDLRDRRLLDLNPDTIDAIRIREGGETVEFRRVGDDWKSSTDPDRTIPNAEIEPMIDSLRLASVHEYRAATESTLADAGLVDPKKEITFDAYLSENTPEAVRGRYPVTTIAIGKSADGKTFVRVDDAPEICAISTEALSDLPDSGSNP